jgi:hypothetical protein
MIAGIEFTLQAFGFEIGHHLFELYVSLVHFVIYAFLFKHCSKNYPFGFFCASHSLIGFSPKIGVERIYRFNSDTGFIF